MSKLKVTDRLEKQDQGKLTVFSLEALELFCFVNGMAPKAGYPRIFYMRLPGSQYIQLNGPAAGQVRNCFVTLGPIKRLKGELAVSDAGDCSCRCSWDIPF